MATKPWARKTLIGTKVGGRPGWEWGSEIKQQLSYLGALLESRRAGVLEGEKVTNIHQRGSIYPDLQKALILASVQFLPGKN